MRSGSRENKILEPSRGGNGMRLNIPRPTLSTAIWMSSAKRWA